MIEHEHLFGPQTASGEQVAFRLFPSRGQVRWMLEQRYRQPWHLKTWPRANRRARLIYLSAWALGSLGVHLPARRMTVRVAEGSLYDQLRQRFHDLGVFLGTPGPNRKIVVFARGQGESWFVKVPISPVSMALARNEAEALRTLSANAALAPLVPHYTWIGTSLAISNIETDGTEYGLLDRAEIVRVHQLLYERSHFVKALSAIRAEWATKKERFATLRSAEASSLIEEARRAALAFIALLNPDTSIDCYMAHGDFTRWNVLRARDGSARIIDWELFGPRVRFFDLFHYLVSQAILVDRQSASVIYDQTLTFVDGLMDRRTFALYFGLYLADQSLTYCRVFECQSVLHKQAFWQLQTWKSLLDQLSRSVTVLMARPMVYETQRN